MDLLTDVLQEAGLRRRLLDLRRLDPDVALRFPCQKSMGLHVVARGRLQIHSPELSEPLALEAGDIALMARGCDHVVSAEGATMPARIVSIAEPWLASPRPGPSSDTANVVISGAYQFWNDPVHPLFRELPGWFVLRARSLAEASPIATTVALLDAEMETRHLGADTIVYGLLDVIFTYLLREIVERLGKTKANWSHAVGDALVRKAVALMHADCARPWTLGDFAGEAGLSRTAFAMRFRAALGDTPLNHLRLLRMQKAMKLLAEGDRKLEQIAQDVGYRDAFGFSKVFKRVVGSAPGEFRRKNRLETHSPWRLQVG